MVVRGVPEDLLYTEEHEWIKIEGRRARIGITDYAQKALTDVVYVELPDTGETFKARDSLGVVESVKSVSDVFAPLAGKVVEVNAALESAPETMNDDPYGAGWYCVLELSDPGETKQLLDAAGYLRHLEKIEG